MVTITDEKRNEIANSIVNLLATENVNFKDAKKMCYGVITKLEENSQVQLIKPIRIKKKPEYEVVYSDRIYGDFFDLDDLTIKINNDTGEYEVEIETIYQFDDFSGLQQYLTTLKDNVIHKLGLEGAVHNISFNFDGITVDDYAGEELESYMYLRFENYIRECLFLYDCKQLNDNCKKQKCTMCMCEG